MIYNHYHNTYLSILHDPYYDTDIMDKTYSPDSIVPKDLTIATWNNRKTKGLLEIQLDLLKIPYTNPAKGVTWTTNRQKIKTLQAADIKTKYFLALDCYDVIICNSLANIVNTFQKTGAKILYNASLWLFPIMEMEGKTPHFSI